MSHWTPQRIARLGFMAGRGFSLTSIMADDTIAARSERAVRVAASRWHLPIGGVGLLPVALSLDDRHRLDDAARARGTTSAELALALLRVVVQQDLIKAVIDDGGDQ
jgi:hypothetical protein